MRFYHVTPHADAILSEGFRDGEGYYGLNNRDEPLRGVFVSDLPVGVDEAQGDILSIDLPDDIPFDNYEWLDNGAPVVGDREWHFPAALLNERGVMRLHERMVDPPRPDWAPPGWV
jgi:hypothetical protein